MMDTTYHSKQVQGQSMNHVETTYQSPVLSSDEAAFNLHGSDGRVCGESQGKKEFHPNYPEVEMSKYTCVHDVIKVYRGILFRT